METITCCSISVFISSANGYKALTRGGPAHTSIGPQLLLSPKGAPSAISNNISPPPLSMPKPSFLRNRCGKHKNLNLTHPCILFQLQNQFPLRNYVYIRRATVFYLFCGSLYTPLIYIQHSLSFAVFFSYLRNTFES